MNRILITGGAGFIGLNTSKLLLNKGYNVTILDNFDNQVHSNPKKKLIDISKDFKVINGDIRNRKTISNLVKDVDGIIHLAAAVGVGQSAYAIDHYVDNNTKGTALLLDILVNIKHNVKKIVVASSMSIYGEGQYLCEKCNKSQFPSIRNTSQLKNKIWDFKCKTCGELLKPIPTNEEKPIKPTSIYAMTKHHQEEMCLLIGKTYGLPITALRYFNAYGPGQSISNPYTGVASIFLSRILAGKNPYIFEDGMQQRDFIHVSDIAQANLLALTNSSGNYRAINIGTGKPTSIINIANILTNYNGNNIVPEISGKYRSGDIRNCFGDVTYAKKLLGFEAKTNIEKGLKDLFMWAINNKNISKDLFSQSLNELKDKNLVI